MFQVDLEKSYKKITMFSSCKQVYCWDENESKTKSCLRKGLQLKMDSLLKMKDNFLNMQNLYQD